ncbi:MAG TPA: hypothetical protein DEF36_16060 [Desulfotomaculum sp.]|nr:hypothetical protein [Desulfotomaculum sp.]
MLQGMKLKTKMFLMFLPVVILGFISLQIINHQMTKAMVDREISEKMDMRFNNIMAGFEEKISAHQRISETLAVIVEGKGLEMSREEFGELLQRLVMVNDDTLGMGVWYEPYRHSAGERYFGPAVYMKGNKAVYTGEYEKEDYDYHSWEWYQNGRIGMAWTDPYYDSTTGITIITTTVPFHDQKENFQGVITADVNLNIIQKLITGIHMEEGGCVFLLDRKGRYITHSDQEKIMKNLSDEKESEFSGLGKKILMENSGTAILEKEKERFRVYYYTLSRTGWKIVFLIPEKELYASVYNRLYLMMLASLIIMLAAVAVIVKFSRHMVNRIEKINNMALSLSSDRIGRGHRTEIIDLDSADEIGLLATRFNDASAQLNDLFGRLRSRVLFEQLISSISTGFINLGHSETDTQINSALREIGKFTGAGRCYVFLLSNDGTRLYNSHQWRLEEAGLPGEGKFRDLPAAGFSRWLEDKVFETVCHQSPKDLRLSAGGEASCYYPEGTHTLVEVPMVYGGSLRGFWGFYSARADVVWKSEDIRLFSMIGEIFVNALVRKEAEMENLHLNLEIEDTQREIIFTLGEIAEARSYEMGNHVKRMAEYSKLLGLKYGLSEYQAELLKLASPIHDIGKLAIPDAILLKPGKLTPEEFEVMKTHSLIGYKMLYKSKREIMKTAATIALQHHERYNGSGYPYGLKGKEIHIYGRITALADVFDALGSVRVYKDAWGLDLILEYFRIERGEYFDPDLVDIFFENIEEILNIRNSLSDDQQKME